MYINRTCPLVNRENQVPMGQPWQCNDLDCRFQIDGVCAIIGAFVESKDNRHLLNAIAQKVGIT